MIKAKEEGIGVQITLSGTGGVISKEWKALTHAIFNHAKEAMSEPAAKEYMEECYEEVREKLFGKGKSDEDNKSERFGTVSFEEMLSAVEKTIKRIREEANIETDE